MTRSFADQATRDVFDGEDTKAARRACPRNVWSVAVRRLDRLNQAEKLTDLRIPPGNRLEKLRGDRAGQYSIRINVQFRVCFDWTEKGPTNVEIVDYHF